MHVTRPRANVPATWNSKSPRLGCRTIFHRLTTVTRPETALSQQGRDSRSRMENSIKSKAQKIPGILILKHNHPSSTDVGKHRLSLRMEMHQPSPSMQTPLTSSHPASARRPLSPDRRRGTPSLRHIAVEKKTLGAHPLIGPRESFLPTFPPLGENESKDKKKQKTGNQQFARSWKIVPPCMHHRYISSIGSLLAPYPRTLGVLPSDSICAISAYQHLRWASR